MNASKPQLSEHAVVQHRCFVSRAIAQSLLTLPFADLDATDPDGVICRYYQKLVESPTGDLTNHVLGLVSLIQGDAELHAAAGNHHKGSIELRWCAGLLLHYRQCTAPEPPEPTAEQVLDLTPAEVATLRQVHEFVRVHMAHHHTWDERDAAMSALSKVIASIKEAS